MRRLISFNMMTLDGFFEGPNHDINWHNVDDEFNEYAIAQLYTVDTLVFGRVTCELMASYWPTPEAVQNDPVVANLRNTTPKIVFSRSLSSVDWANTRLLRGDAVQELATLKQQAGKDLFIFGSANLSASLLAHGMIDEFRVMVNPVLLGRGTPLFQDVPGPLHLELVNARTFRNGNVLLTYACGAA